MDIHILKIGVSSEKICPFLTPSMLMFFLYVVRYVPSAKECPLLLQLPNGEISKTNGFISPVSYHAFIIFILSVLMKFSKATKCE
jgi:hypothetical protein